MNDERIEELLEELKDLLPAGPPHQYQIRKNSLTAADLALIAEVVKRVTPPPVSCGLGFSKDECFSHEEIGILKHVVRWGIRGMALVGVLLVTAFFTTLAAIFGKGFWAWLKGH